MRLLRAVDCLFVAVVSAVAGGAAEVAGASPFEGNWSGEVTAPNTTTEIGFAFHDAGRGLMARFHMPAMFVDDAALGPVTVEGRTVTFAGLDTRLTLDATGARLTGTFGLPHLPVALHRGNFATKPPAMDFPEGPAPRWAVSLGGETWASPVVRDGVVYIGSADGHFHAIDAHSGGVIWTWTGATPIYGTALVTDGRVTFVDANTNVICLGRSDGRLQWRTCVVGDSRASAKAPANPTFNHRTPTPVLYDGTLWIGSADGGLYVLDPAKGAIRSRDDLRTPIFATIGVADDVLWIGGYDGSVVALDPRSRRELVRTKLAGAVVSTPVVAGDTVVVGCRDYMLYGLRRADLSIAWRFSLWFSWVESTPAVVDGVVYVGGSDFARVTALEPETGRAAWSSIVRGMTWGTPLVTADTIYAGASAQHPALIPHEGGLVALDRKTGAAHWRNSFAFRGDATRAGVIGSPALAADSVIVATFDGTLLAFPLR